VAWLGLALAWPGVAWVPPGIFDIVSKIRYSISMQYSISILVYFRKRYKNVMECHCYRFWSMG